MPSDAEWDVLVRFVDPNWVNNSYTGNVAGTKLKATTGWGDNGNGTDDYGFSAMPGGYGRADGDIGEVGGYNVLWSATESGSFAWTRSLFFREGKSI